MNKTALFYDTETTGLPDWNQPSDAPQQPHLVQLAACMVDLDTREIVQSIDVIIAPFVWEIPSEVAAVHGITTEKARAVGIPEPLALEMFLHLWRQSDARVAHNESFDARIVRIGFKRHMDDAIADQWKAGKSECTAKLATPICALPPTERMVAAGRYHHKTPSLTEAYRHFTGEELVNAHSAMADVRACMAVYFALHEREPIPA
jgi:DNA polymerase-3 subunit epsilon